MSVKIKPKDGNRQVGKTLYYNLNRLARKFEYDNREVLKELAKDEIVYGCCLYKIEDGKIIRTDPLEEMNKEGVK